MSERPTKFVSTHPESEIVLSNECLHVSKFSNSGWRNLITNSPIPRSQRYYYYEITVRGPQSRRIMIGVGPENPTLNGHPGNGPNQGYAFYVLTSTLYDGGNTGQDYAGCPTIKDGDVVGFALDVEMAKSFVTVNGNALGDAFLNMKLSERMYPVVALHGACAIEANFGKQPFLYQDKTYTKSIPSYPTDKGTFLEQWVTKVQKAPVNQNKRFCDHLANVTLRSKDGQEFKCHKLVLSVRSDVFKAMFEPEKHTGEVVNISEFDGNTLRKMVEFIYTDAIDGYESEIDMDLFAIAHTYQLDRLSNLCLDKLSKEITEDNVLDAWMAADLFQEKDLATQCEDFILQNWARIKRSRSFEEMKLENKDKLIQLFTNLKI